jgi:chromosome segregation ATPase
MSTSQLIAQADALARMTFELNIRSVAAQADRLEQDLRQLVVRTAQDEEFREKNEHRLNEIWHEILAVKTRMSEVHDGQQQLQTNAETRGKLVADLLERYGKEMAELRDMFNTMNEQLDRLQASKDLLYNAEPGRFERPGVETRAMTRQKKSQKTQNNVNSISTSTKRNEEPPAHIVDAVLKRIQETLSSTRRWNRDHKTTKVDDGTFVASYLKQQSKRDPSMAVFIQKNIRRRIRRRLPRGATPPESLEEFCRDVRWQDVTETVELILVRNEDNAIQALR